MASKTNEFEYACFISYRYAQGALIKEFIDELALALKNRLGILGFEKKVFVDRERLKHSHSVNPGLADAICRSVCMIVVYNNNYFDKNHPFCAKEYCAMVELEKERLGAKNYPKKINLIIPIVLRHPENIPAEIINRNPCDFSKIYTDPEEHYRILNRKKKMRNQSYLEIAYPKEIEEIAAIIVDVYNLLTLQNEEMCSNCEQFDFPNEAVVSKFLEKTAYRPVFPIGGVKP